MGRWEADGRLAGIPVTPALGRLSPEAATSFRSGRATERDFDSKSYSSQSSEQYVWQTLIYFWVHIEGSRRLILQLF